MGEVASRRPGLRGVLAALLLLGAGAALPGRTSAQSIIDTGSDSSYSNSRKVIKNNWGYWVFYNTGNEFDYAYSPDGVTWTPGVSVFDTVGNNTINTGSIWYLEDGSSTVYVAAGSGKTDTSVSGTDPIWMNKGTLQSNGTISWVGAENSDFYTGQIAAAAGDFDTKQQAAITVSTSATGPTVVFVGTEGKRNNRTQYAPGLLAETAAFTKNGQTTPGNSSGNNLANEGYVQLGLVPIESSGANAQALVIY